MNQEAASCGKYQSPRWGLLFGLLGAPVFWLFFYVFMRELGQGEGQSPRDLEGGNAINALLGSVFLAFLVVFPVCFLIAALAYVCGWFRHSHFCGGAARFSVWEMVAAGVGTGVVGFVTNFLVFLVVALCVFTSTK